MKQSEDCQPSTGWSCRRSCLSLRRESRNGCSRRRGYQVEDHHLTTRAETDAFKEKHDVKTTPQTWIGDERIGGYTDLAAHFGNPDREARATQSYQPVAALFGMIALMALGAAWVATEAADLGALRSNGSSASRCARLAYLKLRDVESFSTMFLNYDLLAKRWVPYGYIYPFAEGLAGVLDDGASPEGGLDPRRALSSARSARRACSRRSTSISASLSAPALEVTATCRWGSSH